MNKIKEIYERFSKVALADLGEDFVKKPSNIFHYIYALMSDKLRASKINNYCVDKIIHEYLHFSVIYQVNVFELNIKRSFPYSNNEKDIYNFNINFDYGSNPLNSLVSIADKYNLQKYLIKENRVKNGFLLHEFLHYIIGGHFNIWGERLIANYMYVLDNYKFMDVGDSWNTFVYVYENSRYNSNDDKYLLSIFMNNLIGKEKLVWDFVNKNLNKFNSGGKISINQLEEFGKDNNLFIKGSIKSKLKNSIYEKVL